jgi:flagellar motor switch protein FliM
MEGIIVRILANMREAWTQVIDLRPRLGQIETNPQFAQIVPPSEMVVLVTLETKVVEEEGMMNFCIPYLTIEPIISKLSSQFWFSSVRRSSTTQYLGTLKEKLSSVDMDVVAEIGSINLPIRDVLSLQVGDVVRLSNTRAGDPLTLSVGNKKKFYCQPGVVGKKMAVQITGKIEENEEEEFEELSVEGDDSNE